MTFLKQPSDALIHAADPLQLQEFTAYLSIDKSAM